jgi:DNA repair exonuclease SbcCD ATPase subunit
MTKTELARRLRETRSQIAMLETELKNPHTTQARIPRVKRELTEAIQSARTLAEELGDFVEKGEPEAAQIRKQIAELWPGALATYNEFTETVTQISRILSKLRDANKELMALASRHNQLLGPGDGIYLPNQLQVDPLWYRLVELSQTTLLAREPPAKPNLMLLSEKFPEQHGD